MRHFEHLAEVVCSTTSKSGHTSELFYAKGGRNKLEWITGFNEICTQLTAQYLLLLGCFCNCTIRALAAPSLSARKAVAQPRHARAHRPPRPQANGQGARPRAVSAAELARRHGRGGERGWAGLRGAGGAGRGRGRGRGACGLRVWPGAARPGGEQAAVRASLLHQPAGPGLHRPVVLRAGTGAWWVGKEAGVCSSFWRGSCLQQLYGYGRKGAGRGSAGGREQRTCVCLGCHKRLPLFSPWGWCCVRVQRGTTGAFVAAAQKPTGLKVNTLLN